MMALQITASSRALLPLSQCLRTPVRGCNVMRSISCSVQSSTAVHRASPIHNHNHLLAPPRSFSTSNSSSSSSFSPVDWWRNRQERQEAEKYKKRIVDMSNQETWTLNDMLTELDEVVKSWMAKVPGLNSNKEMLMAKQMHKTVTGLCSVVGTDATSERLEATSRIERLKAAVAAEASVEDINALISQFETMSLMHRVLRQRKLENKSIPTTSEGIQALLQSQGSKLLTKTQKTKMAQTQKRMMKKFSKRSR